MRRITLKYLYDIHQLKIITIVFAIVASVFTLSLIDAFDRAIEYELTTRTGNR
jgi:hypothetical protein